MANPITRLPAAAHYVNRPPARDAEPPVDRHDVAARELRRLPAVHDGETAYERHKRFMTQFGPKIAPARHTAHARSEYDLAREHSRFVWRPEDGSSKADGLTWEERVAKKYYDRLFKEYAIADLARFESGHIGLRWRTEREVVDGKGQFICATRGCEETVGLRSYEVNFQYNERGERRCTLVKLRVCTACAAKLNHRSQHRESRPGQSGHRGAKRRAEHRDTITPDDRSSASPGRQRRRAGDRAPAASCDDEQPAAAAPAPPTSSGAADAMSVWRQADDAAAGAGSMDPEIARASEFEDYLLEMLL
mmetsp:Transcript_3898/g.10074  ORF Transcript_3898/g.10074 Transcript_3898/m.10074 type:complete len:306 (+) Transcript_3898:83-1000(+)